MIFIGMAASLPACAESPRLAPDQLRLLADSFVSTVGKKMESADAYLAGRSPEEARLESYFDNFDDGEPLLLQIQLYSSRNKNLPPHKFQDAFSAIKSGKDVLLSLSEFASFAGFPIKVDGPAGLAEGWHRAQENTFRLDAGKRVATVSGRSFTLEEGDLIEDGGDIFVRSALLAQWFDVGLKADLQSQTIGIYPLSPLPIQERIDRLGKRGLRATPEPPQQPLLESEYKTLSMPRADVYLRQSFEKVDRQDMQSQSRYSVNATGDLFRHTARTFVTGTDEAPLSNLRVNFSRESPDPDLLGFLKARYYAFNDVDVVNVPFTGGGGVERGARVSNKSSRFTLDTTTVIDGDGAPGWDVELYRETSYIDGATIDETGRYAFTDIPLYAGNNNFRLLFFGPQGERREEERVVTVAPGLQNGGSNYYDLSLTQRDTQTYQDNDDFADDADRGSLRAAGTYERAVTDNLVLRTGFHTREKFEGRDNYIYTGAAAVLGKTIYNADAVTTTEGPYRLGLTGRTRQGRHSLSATGFYTSEGFSEQYLDDSVFSVPSLLNFGVSATGPFMAGTLRDVNYQANVNYAVSGDGVKGVTAGADLASRYKGLIFNNGLYYTQRDGLPPGSDDMFLRGRTAVGGRYGLAQWNSSLTYEVEPDLRPVDYTMYFRRTLGERTSGNLDIMHNFDQTRSTVSTGVSYRHDKAIISPTVSYDSDNNLYAGVNVNFGLAYDPYDDELIMSSQSLGNKAGLSTFVYLDKNGDGLFNGGDEPLENVIVKAVHFNRFSESDAEGKGFIADLPVDRVTDIVMEESSAFDPAWVAGIAGYSVRPRAADVTRIEFPVLRGAEMDGTAYIPGEKGAKNPARSLGLKLVTPEGVVAKETQTPFDGFFVIPAIKPGIYYLVTDSAAAPVNAYMPPQRVVVTTEGGQIYGNDLLLTRHYNIPFTFRAANRNPAVDRRTKVLREQDIAREDVYIILGEYHSQAALTMAWYKFKLLNRAWAEHLSLAAGSLGAIAPRPKTGTLPLALKPGKPLTLAQAGTLCQTLVDKGFKCGVEVVTTFQEAVPTAAAAPSPAPAEVPATGAPEPKKG